MHYHNSAAYERGSFTIFIKDLQNSTTANVLSTPLKTSFDKPSIIVCSQSSIVKKSGSDYEIVGDSKDQRYTPDIDKLFNSFAPYSLDFDIEILIMTGIGNDSVKGARNLKENGAKIIVEDEKSCAVYGMPRVAVEKNIADEIKSLSEIIEYIKDL